MTNGEKIQSLFPNKCPHVGFNEKYGQVWIMENGKDVANFTLDWWNAEYKESTTKNDSGVDCVSRAYLLDDSRYHTVFNDDTGNFEDVVYREDIEKAPPVKPQPRKGHWISKPHVYGVTYCLECDFELKIDDTNYCPNCGAKMEKRFEEVEK